MTEVAWAFLHGRVANVDKPIVLTKVLVLFCKSADIIG